MEFPRIIYALRHDKTGKVYIGSTSDLQTRIRHHANLLKNGRHTNQALQADFNQDEGLTLFLVDVVHGMDDRCKEKLWMDALHSRDSRCGYNGKDQTKAATLEGKPAFSIPVGDELEYYRFNYEIGSAAIKAVKT